MAAQFDAGRDKKDNAFYGEVNVKGVVQRRGVGMCFAGYRRSYLINFIPTMKLSIVAFPTRRALVITNSKNAFVFTSR